MTELLAIALTLAVIGLIGGYTVRTGISPVPTSRPARAVMLAALPERIDGPIAELGAGIGTLALPLARAHPDTEVRAYELSPLPWLVLRLRALAGPPNLRIERGDFFRTPMHDVRLVVTYLYPGAMARLRPKLEAELPPGALVLSNTFAVPGWTPERSLPVGGALQTRVYLYRM
jgi:hypothetical protein